MVRHLKEGKIRVNSCNPCSNTSGETSLMMNALKSLWQL